MAGHGVIGLWSPALFRLFLVCLPGVLAAIFLGRAINRRLDRRRFILIVHVGLILAGAVLLAQSAWTWLSGRG